MAGLLADIGIPESAAKLHTDSIVIDGLLISRWSTDLIARLRAGGVTAANFTVATWEGFRETMDILALWLRRLDTMSDQIMLVETAQDILDAKTSGKVGVILGFQNVTPIEDDLNLLALFHRLGVRIVQLAYNLSSLVAGSATDRVDRGLTEFGVAVVQELNRLGIVIDLSHVGERSAMEAIEVSTQPVAITHANPRAMLDIPRNKSDEVIAAVAKKDGVVGASVLPTLLSLQGTDVTLADYLDVIEHHVCVAGINHVGIGTDFTIGQPSEAVDWWYGGPMLKRRKYPFDLSLPFAFPPEVPSEAYLPRVTAGLLERGFAKEDVRKILGGNFLRLFQTVWGSPEQSG